MTERDFEKGRCYFLVGYLDRQCKFPFVQSYVFLGMDSAGGEGSSVERWMFQDVQSYFKHGEHRKADESNGIDVLMLQRDDLDTMLSSHVLAEEFERLGV